MTIAQIMEKMIAFSEGNIHDIDHLIRVWSYARTILPARSAVRSTGTPTGSTRRRRACPWSRLS